ncbi:hypothetical protein G7085_12785 [Tessaracoccus sp. HDW20]|uniref:hypothetical protein n=1 Tax=Tessaracoccus coleopterorum TaxID=2714950 RepID=UPI0018D36E6B|nr:hypothetical protein [Tessaracoccus coleopterorum]NHB85201.1 hypothetical protein [Tessaracoccus coleopterorum]
MEAAATWSGATPAAGGRRCSRSRTYSLRRVRRRGDPPGTSSLECYNDSGDTYF